MVCNIGEGGGGGELIHEKASKIVNRPELLLFYVLYLMIVNPPHPLIPPIPVTQGNIYHVELVANYTIDLILITKYYLVGVLAGLVTISYICSTPHRVRFQLKSFYSTEKTFNLSGSQYFLGLFLVFNNGDLIIQTVLESAIA